MHVHFCNLTDKQINHTDENDSREKIQAIDTSRVSVYGKNSEAEHEIYGNDNNPCTPNYNPNCHYHQVFRQKTSCDNHEKHLSPNVGHDEDIHHKQVVDKDYEYPSSPNERRQNFSREDRVSVTKIKGSKLRSGKIRNVSSLHLSDKKGDRNDMCDHCHCAIKTTYTRQIRHADVKKLENKDKAMLLDQMEPLFEDGTYTGKLIDSISGGIL